MPHLSRRLPVLFLLLALPTLAAAAKPNFKGEWKLNVAKSEFGEFPPPSTMTQTIAHEEPTLKVATKMSTDNGDMNFDATYTTDGKESVNQFGPNEMKSTANWEGDALVIQTKGKFGDSDFAMNDKWSLSEDAKTLTLKRHFSSSMGEMDQKLVLEKQ